MPEQRLQKTRDAYQPGALTTAECNCEHCQAARDFIERLAQTLPTSLPWPKDQDDAS